jgi:CubicO group peptidase (beta-lactamase class C family)
MRIEKKYEGVQSAMTMQAAVGLCSGNQWSDVTLLNTLDMATGNYASAGYEVDEGSANAYSDFFSVNTYSQKATHACSYPRMSKPGTAWVYHTSDSFLLGSALNTIYKQKEGDTKDYYRDMLVTELWKPLKTSPTTWTSSRTNDSVAAPFTGYGLTLHHDDMVKIGEFLNKNNASIGGVQMLDSTLYNEAMQRTSNHGLTAGAANYKYLHGFWAWDAGSTDSGAAICPNAKWIPFMSGFGGIGLVLLPNNMVYYYVSDNHEYEFKNAVMELNKIRNICN